MAAIVQHPTTTVDDLLSCFEAEDTIAATARRASQTGGCGARRASVMLASLLSAGAEPELNTFLSALQAQAKSADGTAAAAEGILRQVIAHPTLQPTAVIVNAVLDCHAKRPDGSAVRALQLLREAQHLVRLDVISYNTAINCAAKCADGSGAAALDLLAALRQDGLEANSVTFHSVLDALSRKGGSAREAERLLQEMQGRGLAPDLSMYTTAIAMIARSRDGSGEMALQLLGSMKAGGIAPSAITLNSVIDCQAKQGGSARMALVILDAMRQAHDPSVRPTVVSYTACIDCQAKCPDGDARTAVALLEEMVAEGLAPNNQTFGAAMNVCAKRGTARMASSILAKMKAAGLAPSHVQYNAVLDAHSKCADGSAQMAAALLLEMVGAGVAPNVVSFSTAIDAQSKRDDGSAEKAAELFAAMLAAGVQPDSVTFAGVIDAQAKKRDGSAAIAAGIIGTMDSYVAPNMIHFNSALNACANQRPSDIGSAQLLLGKMLDRGFRPNQYTMSALLRAAAFAQPARPDMARQWFGAYAPGLEINDHVTRALRQSLPGAEVEDLVRGAGHTVIRRPQRTGSASSSPGSSPPLDRRQSSSSPTTVLGGEQQQRRRSGRQQPADWRRATPADATSPTESGPSSSLFSQPMRVARRDSWRGGAAAAPTSSLFSQPMRVGRRDSGAELMSPTTPTTPNGSGSFALLPTPPAAPSSSSGRTRLSLSLSPPTDRRASDATAPAPRPARRSSVSAFDVMPVPGGEDQQQKQQVSRLSLSDKIKMIRNTPLESRPAPMGPPKRRSSALLSPEFFGNPSSLTTATATRRGSISASAVLREPSGPDGTRGFGSRRSSMALLEQAVIG